MTIQKSSGQTVDEPDESTTPPHRTDSNAPDSHPSGTTVRFPIVGIGASARDLPALEQFFGAIPPDSGMAFIVVPHNPHGPRDTQSDLLEFLQQHARLPIVPIDGDTRVQPDHLFLLMAGAELEIADGVLHLVEPAHDQDPPAPIDRFLQALATDQGANAIGVLLSGTGADGARGVEAVKAQNGATFVQTPTPAEHADEHTAEQGATSHSAVAADSVDRMAAARELAETLVEHRNDITRIHALADAQTSAAATPEVLHDILMQLQAQTGHDLSHYKHSTLLRRVGRRLQATGADNLASYRTYLRENPAEAHALFKDCLISVTSFFREARAFAALENRVIPALLTSNPSVDPLRVWIPGCATGEEAYSVAMLLLEEVAKLPNRPQIQLFATDIDERAIAVARQGRYPKTIETDVSTERLQRFFTAENDGYRVRSDVRELVLFAVHDLLKDPPFSKLDLISCRNLLIYLNRAAQEKIFELFYYALNPHGYLFLGTSESADAVADLFAAYDKTHHIFQRQESGAPPRRIPTLPPFDQSRKPSAGSERKVETKRSIEEMYQARTLRRHAPPRLIVNEEYEITHMFSGAVRYLHEREGAITQNILQKVLPGLRLDLRAALYQAFQKGEGSESRLLQVEIGDTPHLVQLEINPIEEPDFPQGYVEVVFHEKEEASLIGAPDGAAAADGSAATDDVHDSLVARLEEELQRTRARLQTIIEEHEIYNEDLKASNEELQSINEELKSTTEELETSKEELQSMNEELVAVNQELEQKIVALRHANSDLQNLIASTDVGTIFLDRDLYLKRFTPRATELFHLIETDVGRPFAHISHRLQRNGLLQRAARVVQERATFEEVMQSDDERWYIMRMFPYRTVEDTLDGVVLTFIDITAVKRAEHEQTLRKQQEIVADLGRQALEGIEWTALLHTAAEQVAATLQIEFCAFFELTPDQQTLRLAAGIGWRKGSVGQSTVSLADGQIGYTLRTMEPVIVTDWRRETRFTPSALLTDHHVASGASIKIPGFPRPHGVLAVYSAEPRAFTRDDINFLESVAHLLAQAAAHEDAEKQLTFQANVLSQLQDAVIAVDQNERITYLNAAAAVQSGLRVHEALGRQLRDVPPYEWLQPQQREEMQDALAATGHWRNQHVHVAPHGEKVHVDAVVNVLRDENETRTGLLAVIRDITEQKRAEEARRESEERFRIMADTAPVLIWMSGLDKGYTYLNRPWLDFTGRSLDEELGDGWTEGVHPDDYERCLGIYTASFDARQDFEMEYRLRRHDGVYRWVLVRGTPRVTLDGSFLGYIGSCLDITERRQAEEAIRESEARFRQLADAMPQIVWTSDAEGVVEYLNQRWLEYTGLGLAESMGRGVRTVLHPDDLDGMHAKWQTAMETRQPYEDELRLRGADGIFRWHLTRCVPILDPADRIIQWYGTSTNIDDRKRAEIAQQLLSDLNNQIRRLTTPEEIAWTAVSTLGEHLAATLCAFNEVDVAADHVIVYRNWQQGESGLEGTFPLSHYILPQLMAELEAERTVVVHDTATDARTAEAYAQQRVPLDMGAFLLVPCWREAHWVALLLVASDEPRTWREDEVALVEAAATRLWSTVERARAEQKLRESEEQLRLITDNVAGLISYVDADERYRFVNASYKTWYGLSPDEVIGRQVRDVLGESAYSRAQPHINAVLAGERANFENAVNFVDGTVHTVLTTYVPQVDAAGSVLGFYALITDITERKRTEDALRLLAEASSLLASSLEYETTVQNIAHLTVPDFADWCAIDIVEEDGTIAAAALAHIDPDKIRWAEELRQHYPVDPNAPQGMPQVIRSGQSEIYPDITDAMLQQVAKNEEELHLLRSVGYSSAMIAPLQARGRTLGAITFVSTESQRHFDEKDLAVAEELARRAAVAIDNARLYRAVQTSERRLRESEERLRLAVEAGDIGIWDVNVITGERNWSERAKLIYGSPPDEPLPYERLVASIHPEDRARVEEEVAAVRDLGTAERLNTQYRVVHPDGEVRWVMTRGEATYAGEGEKRRAVRLLGTVIDITERVKAEEAVRRSEQQLRNVIDNLYTFVGLLTPDGTLIEANRTALDAASLQPEDVLGKSFDQAYWWAYSEEVQADLRTAIERAAAGESSRYDVTIRLGEDHYIIIDFMLAPIFNDQGQVIYLVPSGLDITERKQQEAALAARAKQQAAVAALSQRALAEDDELQTLLDEVVRTVSETLEVEYCKILELLPDGKEVLLRAGVGWQEGLVGRATVSTGMDSQAGYTLYSARPVIVEDLRSERRFSGPPLLHEHDVVSGISCMIGDKPERPYGVLGAHTTQRRVFTWDDTNFLQAVANVLTSVIQRARAADALRESEERFRSTFENAAVGMAHIDGDGRYLRINARLCEIAGYTREELQQITFQDLTHPDDLANSMAHFEALMRGDIESYHLEKRYYRKDGRIIWIHVTRALQRNAAGRPDYCISVIEDISERKAAEVALQELNESLEARVVQRTEQVRALSSALALAEQWERRRISQILHDHLQQLLYGLQMRTQLLEFNAEETAASDEQAEINGLIDEAIRTTRSLTVELNPPVLAGEGLETSLQWLANHMQHVHGLTVDLDFAPGLKIPNENLRVLLFQLVQELLFNVVKHAGVDRATLRAFAVDEQIRLQVEDAGVGFDVAAFEAREPIESNYGLFSVRERLALFGGRLDIESGRGAGTRMTITAPLRIGRSNF